MLVASSGVAVIADLGVSRLLSSSIAAITTTQGIKGTDRWMAKELYEASESNAYTKEADVWAFGMTVYVSISCVVILLHLKSTCR